MKNKLVLALSFLPVFVLGGAMAYYDFATHFSRVEVVVEGYDPKDFFSGYFMELQPNWAKTDCTQFAEQKCPKEAFLQRYRYFINREQSDKLTAAVNAGVVKLVFSYSEGRTPYIVDLLVDGKSYMEYVTTDFQKRKQRVGPGVNLRQGPHGNSTLPPHRQNKDDVPTEGPTFHEGKAAQ